MTKKLINVGADPGNQGDGDSLREAFIKTNENFNELYSFSPITDATLEHSDPNVEGSIAQKLAECEASGGGVVFVGPGTFNLSTQTLNIGDNCQLVGSGKNATILQADHTFDAIAVDAGMFNGDWAVKDLTIDLPTSVSGHGISTLPSRAARGKVENVMVTGGSVASWGINIDAANGIHISDFSYRGEGSGIRYANLSNFQSNYGDSIIQGSTIFLKNQGTTGVSVESPSLALTNRINNILLSQISVSILGPLLQDTTGIYLRNAGRITLLNVDLERMDTGIRQGSGEGGGVIAESNAFIQVYALGCNTDYLEVGGKPKNQVIVGGQGQFAEEQRLPSSDILAGHLVMGNNRVLTAVRPIEAYIDTTDPRQLTVEDSGTVFTNRGAPDTVTFQLPPANQTFSIEYEFHLSTLGQRIRVQPAPNDIIRPGQTSPGAIYESDATFGQSLKIRNIDGATWAMLSQVGNWNSV